MSGAPVARVICLLAALFCLATGLATVIIKFSEWCQGGGSNWPWSCIGPALAWDNNEFVKNEVNSCKTGLGGRAWGCVFSFAPEIFIPLWTPFFMALIAIFAQFRSMKLEFISKNWARMCLYYLLMALFGAFGYAGNLGILAGFITVLAAFVCLIMAFVDSGSNPSSDYQLMN